MLIQSDEERSFIQTVSTLNYANPFLPERIECERNLLGSTFHQFDRVWHAMGNQGRNPNVLRINERVEFMAQQLRSRLLEKQKVDVKDYELYQDLIFYLLYNRYEQKLYELILNPQRRSTAKIPYFRSFHNDYQHFLSCSPDLPQCAHTPQHLFALFFQVRRAFHHIFDHIIGSSMPIAKLRANIWQSIFTHDLKRYRRSLYTQMGDIATLITGPSGTGKELVAGAIGRSRYIPFDMTRESFEMDFQKSFYPLNLSALSTTLIESELFGHCRGSFTGAIGDRQGWLEVCPALGSVFLDEIGEVDTFIQVKLLRVLQNRTFQRLGDAQELKFDGKFIAATNRDLALEMEELRFREDFYYRLCADMITTPSLKEQILDNPDDIEGMLVYLATKVAGIEEAERLGKETYDWIQTRIPKNYPWPGNVRELEQCVRNIMIRGTYHPRKIIKANDLTSFLENCEYTADELMKAYCKITYEKTGSFLETSRRLNLDRRTVKAKITEE